MMRIIHQLANHDAHSCFQNLKWRRYRSFTVEPVHKKREVIGRFKVLRIVSVLGKEIPSCLSLDERKRPVNLRIMTVS